jgi:hypothetical protein
MSGECPMRTGADRADYAGTATGPDKEDNVSLIEFAREGSGDGGVL